MQKLRNTVIAMSVAIFATSVVTFTATYMGAARDAAMQQRIADLEARLEQRPSLAMAPAAAVTERPTAALPLPPVQDEVAAVQAAVGRRQSGLSAQLTQMIGALRTDPDRGLEIMHVQAQLIDKSEKPGSRFLLTEGIKLMERNVEPKRAEAELRRYFDERENSTYLRALVAGRLAQRGQPDAVQDLLREVASGPLKSKDAVERLKAVVNIASTGSPEATPYLLDMLGDPDFLVRARATEGLSFTGGEDAEQALAQLQNDPTPAVRDAAKRATERMLSSWLVQ